ncbi:SO_0444 family Cu/Zn efflux transporter [SAR92 clade bacterium H246]
MALLENFVALFMESAPWLILGLTVAGIVKVLVPSQLMAEHLGQPGPMATVKAALFGAPLPLCSCGVIPAALGLRRSGASKAATTSFLISTPETGVDSISISYAMLGPFMAIIRPIAAITSAITAGLLVGTENSIPNSASQQPSESCCASKTPEPEPCCSTEQPAVKQPTAADKLLAGLRFTYIDLVRDIALWLVIGLGFAAVIKTYVPNEFLLQWGDGLLAFVVMALVGVPMYICATASTPIAAGLLFSGVSPGATLVFMLVGPATNIATMGLVKTELGNRTLAIYLLSVVVVGFAFGYLTNYLAKLWDMDFMAQAEHVHGMVNTPLAYGASVILAGLMVYGLVRRVKQGFRKLA